MFLTFLIFLTSSIDNFFHPISTSLLLWVFFLLTIKNLSNNQGTFVIPYNLLPLPLIICFFYIIFFIYNYELTFTNEIKHMYNKVLDQEYLIRYLQSQTRDDIQISGLMEGRNTSQIFYSLIQVTCWSTLFFVTISQKIINKIFILNKLLLGSSLYFLFSWLIDLVFLTTIKPEILDYGNFHGISSEPFRQSELALIHFILFFTKFLMSKHSISYKNNNDIKILYFSFFISVLNFLYLANDTFFYCFILMFILTLCIKSYILSKLIYLLSIVSLSLYIFILAIGDGESLKLFFEELNILDHTWEYQFQNHFYGINILKQCGIIGCGFGIWPPIPHEWEPTLFVSTYGGWATEGTLFAKDLAGLWIRLLKDLGIIGFLIICYIFYKIKILMYSEELYLRFFGLGFLIYSLSRLFHSGFYYNADLFLMIFLLVIFSNVSPKNRIT